MSIGGVIIRAVFTIIVNIQRAVYYSYKTSGFFSHTHKIFIASYNYVYVGLTFPMKKVNINEMNWTPNQYIEYPDLYSYKTTKRAVPNPYFSGKRLKILFSW